MWIPSTDQVVVVYSNPFKEETANEPPQPNPTSTQGPEHPLHALRQLVLRGRGGGEPEEDLEGLNFAQLRDRLLAESPLESGHVAAVNLAEADFWKKSEGTRVDWSDRVLGFECGGQQWVFEVCFPAGPRSAPSGADLAFAEGLLKDIEKHNLPAPAPIEMRWTSQSDSLMSPAGPKAGRDDGGMYCWVGIIMYLPTEDPATRAKIRETFKKYCAVESTRFQQYDAYSHWAKLEPPEETRLADQLRERVRARYPVEAYNKARRELDPHGVLTNSWIEAVFGNPWAEASWA